MAVLADEHSDTDLKLQATTAPKPKILLSREILHASGEIRTCDLSLGGERGESRIGT
jgi:hypothetical protein